MLENEKKGLTPLGKISIFGSITALSVVILISAWFSLAQASPGHGGGHGESLSTAEGSSYPEVIVQRPQSSEEFIDFVEASGEILPGKQSDVYALRDGVVEKLFVDVGRYVQKGQIIATLYPDVEQAQLIAERDFLEKELELAVTLNPIDIEIELIQAEIESMKAVNDADSKNIDIQIGANLKQLGQRDSATINALADMVEAVSSLMYTLPNALHRELITSSFTIDNYRRQDLLTVVGNNQFIAVEKKLLAFYADYLEHIALLQDGKEIPDRLDADLLVSKALEILRDVRLFANALNPNFGSNNEDVLDRDEIESIRGDLDGAEEHLLEVSNVLVDKLAENSALESLKVSSDATNEQRILILEKRIENLEKEKELDIIVKTAKLDQIQKQLGIGLQVVSPIGGVVTERFIDAGESVDLDTPLVKVVDDNSKFVRFFISEADVPFIKNGLDIEFSPTFKPSLKYNATVSRISKSIDQETRTILVEADISAQAATDTLFSHMTVRVHIPVNQEAGLFAIPESALELTDANDTVWIIDSELVAKEQSINLAFIHSGVAYLKEDLKEGEWVIVKTPVPLSEGLEVDTKQ